MRPGIFDGVRVVDLTHNLNGPYATKLMADLGADVIKIEEPGAGDVGRGLEGFNTPGMRGYFMYRNVGKRSLSVNLKTPAGLQIVRDLVAVSDVFIDNRKAGAVQRLGLGYDDLVKIQPDIVSCSATGFGQYGPLSHLPGGDIIIQAYSGSLHLTGPRDHPMPPWVPWIDCCTGTHAFGAVSGALFRRAVTGQGDFIDVSMLDCAFNYHDLPVEEYVLSGGKVERQRQGQTHPSLGPPGGVYRVKDGALIISGQREGSWERLCELMGRPEYAQWATREARMEHVTEIVDAIAAYMAGMTKAEASQVLGDLGMLGPPILTIADICEHPHVKERELLVDVPHPLTGEPVKVQNTAIKFTNTLAQPRGAAPLLGQHGDEVLTELLGYEAARVEALWADGVLYAEPAARRAGRVVPEVEARKRSSNLRADWAREAAELAAARAERA